MLKPPPTPILPSTLNDVSMLFAQKPIYEEMEDWEVESVEIARKSTNTLDMARNLPVPSGWQKDEIPVLMDDEAVTDLILEEDEVLTGRGERIVLDDQSAVSERSFAPEGSASVVESELPSVYIARQTPRAPTPAQDDFFQRRLSSSRTRSSSLVSLDASPFIPPQPLRAMEASGVAHSSQDSGMATSDSANSLATVGSWSTDEKSIMQVQMAWRSKPEMSRAQHVRTDSLHRTLDVRPAMPHEDEEDEQLYIPPPQRIGRHSLAQFGPPRRVMQAAEMVHPEPSPDNSVEIGRYDAEQALLMDQVPIHTISPPHDLDKVPSSSFSRHIAEQELLLGDAQTYREPSRASTHTRIPSSSTMPLNLSAAARHNRMPSTTSVHSIPQDIHREDIPFPTLADTSGSADSVDSRAEKRKSTSEKLLNFFAGFLSGVGSGMPEQEAPAGVGLSSAVLDHVPDQTLEKTSRRETIDDSVEMPRARIENVEDPYEYEIPVPRVRVERLPVRTKRAIHQDFIELQPPAFAEDIRPPTRPSNAPYFALQPSRRIPSTTSNIAPAATFDRKGKGRPTMSAFACAALARLPPPGKGSSASGQPVTVRDSERARDLDRRKSVFEGPSRMMPPPARMKRTIPIAGRTPGKASRARAVQREYFDQAVKERLEAKEVGRRRLERLREEEEEREYKKRRRETVIRANPLPETYRR